MIKGNKRKKKKLTEEMGKETMYTALPKGGKKKISDAPKKYKGNARRCRVEYTPWIRPERGRKDREREEEVSSGDIPTAVQRRPPKG